jgi:hypothetical protein
MFIASTGFAVQIETAFPGTIFSAQGRRLNLAGHPMLTCIERIAGFSGGNLNRVLSDFPGNGGWVLLQPGSYFLKREPFL